MGRTDQFWHLTCPESTSGQAQWLRGAVELESVMCSLAPDHQRAGKRLSTLAVTLPNRPVDEFVWTWYFECLIQDSVARFFESHGFTGYELQPAEAVYRHAGNRRPPVLRELLVTGWGGMAPPESGIRLLQRCPVCRHAVYSCFTAAENLIDKSSWDGSDFFMVWPLPNFIFVTDRVCQALRAARFRGFRLVPVSSLHCEGTLTPGRLSYVMREDRARLLGESLDIF